RNVTISADTGSIDVSGTIDASGATPGIINIWAGKDLNIRSTAVFNAHSITADANGKGGQIVLAASQAGDQQGTLNLDVGAAIDVGADQANAIDSGPVFGGQIIFSTSRNATNDGVNLNVNGGNFANFLSGVIGKNPSGVHGESAWDGIVIVGNKTYS